MGTRRIHIVRHGITEWNKLRRFQGHTDVPLSDEGRQQAAATAERLSRVPITHCFASDLSRTFDTATIICDRLGISLEPDEDLREANKGELEGKYRDPVTGLIGDETRSFDENNVHSRPPGGESIVDLRNRCQRFVERFRDRDSMLPDGDVLLVSHGGTMRAMMTVVLDLPVEASRSFHFDNCGLTTIHFRNDLPALLVRYNDSQHLEVLART